MSVPQNISIHSFNNNNNENKNILSYFTFEVSRLIPWAAGSFNSLAPGMFIRLQPTVERGEGGGEGREATRAAAAAVTTVAAASAGVAAVVAAAAAAAATAAVA